MSKMRVHELARELGRTNKEIISFLTNKGMEVKSHMSMLEDDQVDLVRKNVGSRPAPVRREAPAGEMHAAQSTAQTAAPTAREGAQNTQNPSGAQGAQPPKKKNITRIFRSQNSRTGIQKPAGMRTADEKRRPGERRDGGMRQQAGAPARPSGPARQNPANQPDAAAAPQQRPAGTAQPAQTNPAAQTSTASQPNPAAAAQKTADTPAAKRPEAPALKAEEIRKEARPVQETLTNTANTA
ncbi:MAG: translation initiation factor IF-2 N-terminal domain-containing protein, partial [Eubacteriales bacterium]|nr:translation initiation factor IF-2 N-terminal domain-containing protein [Eubacteriales bacterium]